MQKVTKRKSAVLKVLDAEIADLEQRLQKVQPLIDELNQLKKTRATLLSERTTTGGVNSNAQLTMEMMIHFFRERDNEPATAGFISEELNVPGTIVRSHLSRGKDVRYENTAEGWR